MYQFPGPSADLTTATRVATYDLVNTVTLIYDFAFDVPTGTVLYKPSPVSDDLFPMATAPFAPAAAPTST